MKRVAVWATGLLFALEAQTGALSVNPGDNFPANGLTHATSGTSKTDLKFDTSPQIIEDAASVLQETSSSSATSFLGINSAIGAAQSRAGQSRRVSDNIQDSSVLVPVTSSGQPVAVPMPRAGWIGLVGVLGVMFARWHSSRRTRMRATG